ncbi:hypothetical protein [Shimazuella kribbensis]|uniref:hypothetical protein n=1 Tax=Shimazuella kribbensis TaxID=139808 RepID=UPI0003FDC6BF|nr:hypothetical protein [Shimazuella kribbensis]
MKKVLFFLFAIILLIGMTTGCTSNGTSSENTSGQQIQAKIDKKYEDGIDFKVQLSNVKTAKGTWTVKYYDKVQVLKDKGASTIVGYGFGDLGGTDKPNKENDIDLNVNFTGIADGKKVTVDKVYVVTKEEFNKMKVER